MVIENKSTEWIAGVDTMPNGLIFPDGVSAFTNADWIGYEISDFTQFSSSFNKNQYAFNSATGFLSRTDGGTFELNVSYKINFKAKLIADTPHDYVGTANVRQYPHIMRWTKRNQVTLEAQVFEQRGRLEESGSALTGFNQQERSQNGQSTKTGKAVFYMPLPAQEMQQQQQVEVYDENNNLRMADTVKNFVKGFFNARAWL